VTFPVITRRRPWLIVRLSGLRTNAVTSWPCSTLVTIACPDYQRQEVSCYYRPFGAGTRWACILFL
jgi:hypothetical protein